MTTMCRCPNWIFFLIDEQTSHLRDLVDPPEDYGDHEIGNFLQVVDFVYHGPPTANMVTPSVCYV